MFPADHRRPETKKTVAGSSTGRVTYEELCGTWGKLIEDGIGVGAALLDFHFQTEGVDEVGCLLSKETGHGRIRTTNAVLRRREKHTH